MFGARAEVVIVGMPEEKAAQVIGEVFAHFRVMHRRFHPWQPGELLSVNAAIAAGDLPREISAQMAAMITLSADHSRRAEYLFNPALGGLVSLWGFHGAQNKQRKPPDDSAISMFVANMPSLRELKINNQKITSANKKTQLDFGAIAKGAALDSARDILRANGINNALINVGGNIIALGDNNGKPWRAGISAGGGKVFAAVELQDGEALAVSGGGERNFVHNGETYHHIINPRTGNPAKNASLAAVISADLFNAGALSDSCATALVIANEDESRRILKNCGIDLALRITNNNGIKSTITTPQMSRRLQTD